MSKTLARRDGEIGNCVTCRAVSPLSIDGECHFCKESNGRRTEILDIIWDDTKNFMRGHSEKENDFISKRVEELGLMGRIGEVPNPFRRIETPRSLADSKYETLYFCEQTLIGRVTLEFNTNGITATYSTH